MSTSSESQPPGPEQTKQDATTPDKASKSKMDTLLSKLPPSVVRNLKDTRKWKNWFRSMVVIFVCVIYLVVQNTLEVLGQAGFFSRKSIRGHLESNRVGSGSSVVKNIGKSG